MEKEVTMGIIDSKVKSRLIHIPTFCSCHCFRALGRVFERVTVESIVESQISSSSFNEYLNEISVENFCLMNLKTIEARQQLEY